MDTPEETTFDIVHTQCGVVNFITLDGELAGDAAEALERTVQSLPPGCTELIIDIGDNSVSSAFVDVLAKRLPMLVDATVTVVLVTSNSVTSRIVANSLAHLILVSSIEEAMKTLSIESPRPIGDILVREFALNRRAVVTALKKQVRQGGLLGHILLASRTISPVTLAKALLMQKPESE